MKPSLFLLVAVLAGCAFPQSVATDRQPVELAGRTAGAPQHCIPIERLEGLHVSDTNGHIVLYGRGKTIWASSLAPGCGFSVHDVLISEPVIRYCRGDLLRSLDSMSRIPGPTCVLGDFVPYTR